MRPIAPKVKQIYVSAMSTLGSRERSLGAPDLGSERVGALRPEPRSHDGRVAGRFSDPAVALRAGRTRNLRSALSIHSQAFEMSARRSTRSLLFADHLLVDEVAAMTLSRVPSKRGSALASLGCAVLLGVPGLTAVEMSQPSAGPARLAVAFGIAMASLLGLAECLRRVVLGFRWKFQSKPTYEVADLCSWPSGLGNGRQLLLDVCEAADSSSVELVLRVRPENESAIELYRRSGFVPIGQADAQRLERMVRVPRRGAAGVTRPDRLEVPFGVVCGVLIAVVAWSFRSTNSDLLAGACLVGGLGALARASLVDIRELRLPNFWTAFALISGIAGSLVSSSGPSALLGIVVSAAPFVLLHLLDPSALGFGDVKFAAAAGAVVAIVWWPAAPVIAVVALASALAVRLVRPSGPRAFGPNLMAGTLLASLVATSLVSKGIVT